MNSSQSIPVIFSNIIFIIGIYGLSISSLYFIIFMTLPLTIFIIFSFVFSISFIVFVFHVFHFFTVFTMFLSHGVNIDIGFNFSVDVNPVLLVGIDWSKVNIHNVVIGTTMTHDVLEFFPFFIHIMFEIMVIFVSTHWSVVMATHWSVVMAAHWSVMVAAHWSIMVSAHWFSGHGDGGVLVMSDWRCRYCGDKNCGEF